MQGRSGCISRRSYKLDRAVHWICAVVMATGCGPFNNITPPLLSPFSSALLNLSSPEIPHGMQFNYVIYKAVWISIMYTYLLNFRLRRLKNLNYIYHEKRPAVPKAGGVYRFRFSTLP